VDEGPPVDDSPPQVDLPDEQLDAPELIAVHGRALGGNGHSVFVSADRPAVARVCDDTQVCLDLPPGQMWATGTWYSPATSWTLTLIEPAGDTWTYGPFPFVTRDEAGF
jgi:hypothetical protein